MSNEESCEITDVTRAGAAGADTVSSQQEVQQARLSGNAGSGAIDFNEISQRTSQLESCGALPSLSMDSSESPCDLEFPSQESLREAPIMELRQIADRNQTRLLQTVAANIDKLQYTGFHGADAAKMNRFLAANSSVSGILQDGQAAGYAETYMGAVGRRVNDPAQLLSDLSSAAAMTNAYHNPRNMPGASGGVAVMDLSSLSNPRGPGHLPGDFEIRPGQEFGFGLAINAGEYVTHIGQDEFASVVKGVVSPEKLLRYEGAIENPTASPESYERHLLSRQLRQQEILEEAIKLRLKLRLN